MGIPIIVVKFPNGNVEFPHWGNWLSLLGKINEFPHMENGKKVMNRIFKQKSWNFITAQNKIESVIKRKKCEKGRLHFF